MSVRALPGFGGQLLAVDDGREAAALGVLTASSHPLKAVAQRAVTTAVRTIGVHGIRRTDLPTDRTFGLDTAELADVIGTVVPGAHLVGVNLARQAERRRLIALCRLRDGKVVVAKVDAEPGPVEHEGRVLAALGGRALAAVLTPSFVAMGRASTPSGEVAIVVQSAVTVRPHRPVTEFPVDALEAALAERLGPVLGPPPADGWVPSHGDLAPWNLRRTDRGVALVDWETAAYAPRGTDAAYFAACAHAVAGRPMTPITDGAREHLLALLDRRSDAEDVALTARLREALSTAARRA